MEDYMEDTSNGQNEFMDEPEEFDGTDQVEEDTVDCIEYQCTGCEDIFCVDVDNENEVANEEEPCPRCGMKGLQL